MAKIASVVGREILDSRGLPTVETDVVLSDGSFGRAAVPSGASTGSHEAVELRDGDKARYGGKGVLQAVGFVNGVLAMETKGLDAADPSKVDARMRETDATDNKSRLGANAILSVSMAAARAEAASRKKPLYAWLREAYAIDDPEWLLPTPMLNVVNGGKHADSGLDVQEFMLVPSGAKTFADAIRAGAETYQSLKKLLASRKLSTAVGDEGGFAPHIPKHEDVLKTLIEAVGQAGHGGRIFLALDSAASEFYADGSYKFEGKPRSSDEMVGIYAAWAGKYPIRSFEDPLSEDDWDGWAKATAKLGAKSRVIGDDLFVTNPSRLARGIREKSANAILIKLNQIGTLTETVETVRMAQKAGFAAVISHRSGETEDAFIADFAVAMNAGAIKTGAPCRSERNAKYNQLLRIEAELGKKASYAGDRMFRLG